ncbi:MAG TPA: PD-(D/E)XK nuclease family protein [Kamptonema sp.]|nr:PD-(D/E)XK nuclease family protein [Kamptonema sp.]
MFRLSQGQLNLLTTCPRKFQHTYLEQLATPYSPEQQEKLAWGSRFHLLMQQKELGLPIESIVQGDIEMQRCLTAFLDAAPELFTSSEKNDAYGKQSLDTFRQAEHTRTLNLQNYLITVIYDLLIAEPKQAQIFDWKTYPRPQNHKLLAQNWQTRLYLYVLAETSNYLPEQISMTYWFVQLEGETQPQSLKFAYSDTKHEQTRQDLTHLLNKLTDWLQRYNERGEQFPQVEISAQDCYYCQFITRCDRAHQIEENPLTKINAAVPQDWLDNLSIIEEISII